MDRVLVLGALAAYCIVAAYAWGRIEGSTNDVLSVFTGALLWPLTVLCWLCCVLLLRPFYRVALRPAYRLGRQRTVNKHAESVDDPALKEAERELEEWLTGGST